MKRDNRSFHWFSSVLLYLGLAFQAAGQTNVSITVNAASNVHAINPNIYGTAFASTAQLSDLNSPLNRSGGNTTTRHNWQVNACNHGSDWFFESIADGSSTTPGAAMDQFITNSRNGGAQPAITIPMIGWVAKLGPSRSILPSFSVTKYGAQQSVDPYLTNAGNGLTAGGANIAGNDPNDANSSNSPAFQQGFVQHLVNQFGSSANGGVRYYLMDNEPSIWHGTHRDVHPIGSTMREIRDGLFNFAAVVKNLDPSALVGGPEEWGWTGYFYSGYDQQYGAAHNWSPPFPDRTTNGGWDYMPWYLDQARQQAATNGRRLLDIFTLHYYPQGGEFGNDVSSSMQLLRNRSTRSLWDTTYVDASWINDKVQLIPRMKSWVTSNYPGTKIGITEYNWGAEGHMNGATAQADIFGIFGREGLDLGTRWTTPATGSPVYLAMKLFRNYDGSNSAFGDTSVSAIATNADNVSAFAATRSSDGALTVVVVNKQLSTAVNLTISLTNFPATGTAQVWRLAAVASDPTVASISHLSNVTFSASILSNTAPAQSVTLYVLPAAPPPTLKSASVNSTNSFSFELDGQAGLRYFVFSSSNLSAWSPVWSNALLGSSTNLQFAISGTRRFYRAQWWP